MRGTHVCSCGQRFKLPKAGRFNVIAEEDAGTLFYLPTTKKLMSFDALRFAVREHRLDIASAGMVQLPVRLIERGL